MYSFTAHGLFLIRFYHFDLECSFVRFVQIDLTCFANQFVRFLFKPMFFKSAVHVHVYIHVAYVLTCVAGRWGGNRRGEGIDSPLPGGLE